MKRREFLRGATAGVIGGLGMTLAACAGTPPATQQSTSTGGEAPQAQAPAQGSSLPAIEWRMGTSWPVSLDTIYGGVNLLVERVAELSGGLFKITPFPAGELFPGLEVVQNVQQGTVEAGHTALYYYVGLNPAWALGTTVPFGLTTQQQNSWLYAGGGNEAMNELGAEFGVTLFPAGNTGAQMGGWFRRELNALSDLQGLKMRIPGLGGSVMERLGIVTQTLPAGEIFQALSTGAIDAAEWVGPYDDLKLGLPDAADYYYAPGWWEPGPALHAVVNNEQWARLPVEYQRIFAVATWEANLSMLSKYDAVNHDALEQIISSGIELKTYPEEIMAAGQRVAFEIYEENAASIPQFEKIYRPWKQFRDRIYRWHKTIEFPFANFVYNNPAP